MNVFRGLSLCFFGGYILLLIQPLTAAYTFAPNQTLTCALLVTNTTASTLAASENRFSMVLSPQASSLPQTIAALPAGGTLDISGKVTGLNVKLGEYLAKEAGIPFRLLAYRMPDSLFGTTDSVLQLRHVFGELGPESGIDCLVDSIFLTEERREITSFLAPHVLYSYQVVTLRRRKAQTAVWAKILTMFTPFNEWVWGWIMITVLCSSLVYYVLERKENDLDFGEPTIAENLWNSLFFGFATFTQLITYAPRTPVGRLFYLSYTFFILVVLSSYTANLAAFFGKKDVIEGAESLKDLLAKKLCVAKQHPSHRQWVSEHLPATKIVQVDSVKSIMESVRDGRCAGGLSTDLHLRGAFLLGDFCDLTLQGQPLNLGYYAIPFRYIRTAPSYSINSPEAYDALNTLLVRALSSGALLDLLTLYMPPNPTALLCKDTADEESDGDDVTTLTFYDMAGIFAIHALLTVFVIALFSLGYGGKAAASYFATVHQGDGGEGSLFRRFATNIAAQNHKLVSLFAQLSAAIRGVDPEEVRAELDKDEDLQAMQETLNTLRSSQAIRASLRLSVVSPTTHHTVDGGAPVVASPRSDAFSWLRTGFGKLTRPLADAQAQMQHRHGEATGREAGRRGGGRRMGDRPAVGVDSEIADDTAGGATGGGSPLWHRTHAQRENPAGMETAV
ncbi:unnamed protein product [Vitrella brassicaformis CCMP3155]|uniref:Ionotropic glutamate receptor C-terminal domain-containing protein n=1 Tax=Vitrella brassicaformis (strain CCMP3155) TaxID=1169540 RepID=A0A0G4F524_VITBC|nr:unnamed protein product [Vitrella brassicaformis CCMP3155]|eukprot:CEM07581.1 unnamed protein product [Vitrella brassicaformis CCMP3155]